VVPFEAAVHLPRGDRNVKPPVVVTETRLPTVAYPEDWSAGQNILLEDGVVAEYWNPASGTCGEYGGADAFVEGQAFGFNIPAEAVITSILCQYKCRCPQGGHQGRVCVGTTNFPASFTTATYVTVPSPDLAWVEFEATDPALGHPVWTAAELALIRVRFGTSAQVTNDNREYVDNIRVKVTYMI